MGSNNGFTIFYNTFAIRSQGAGLQQFYNKFARRIFTIHSQSACFTIIFTIFIQILCSPFLFFYLKYTYTGNRVAGSPLFFRNKFFCYILILSARNGSYLYFLLLWQGNSFFVLFSFGKGRVTGVTFIYCHRGGAFKGLLSSRVYLYCWLPK